MAIDGLQTSLIAVTSPVIGSLGVTFGLGVTLG
ncbi:MAG: hypothetical protein KatS3mg008_0950 [Acidimicrobiales bacterium]|nr:MAG: hypothetical protein KatS3mg008_0950 [Acidimicrobiales bacterium]